MTKNDYDQDDWRRLIWAFNFSNDLLATFYFQRTLTVCHCGMNKRSSIWCLSISFVEWIIYYERINNLGQKLEYKQFKHNSNVKSMSNSIFNYFYFVMSLTHTHTHTHTHTKCKQKFNSNCQMYAGFSSTYLPVIAGAQRF